AMAHGSSATCRRSSTTPSGIARWWAPWAPWAVPTPRSRWPPDHGNHQALMRIHFIGICGYAVSGLALVAKQLGNDVTGSDEDAYPPTTEILTRGGIPWGDGHDAGNVTRWGKPDLVVQGNQVREGNPETETARRLDI